ncbi:hypothetical protein KJ966_29315 [bacterium]|nr:hypothetical protein [bacterium]
MKFFFSIIIITVIALVGSRLTFFNRRLPIGFRHILLTGTEYIFIGLLLGSAGLGLMDHETLLKLDSFLLFGLTWVGFLFGLQFEVRLLRNLPRYYFSITAVQSGITFLLVTVFMYICMASLLDLPTGILVLSAMTLGATSSCSAQSAIAIVNKNYSIKNKGLLDLMRYISSVDGLFALIFFAIVLCLFPANGSKDFFFLESAKWLGLSVITGAFPGIVLVILSKSRFSQQEYSLFLIGSVLLCGGIAHQLNNSPLIAGLTCGIIAANFCRHRLRALQIVVQAEKSIYILLLLIAGAMWKFKLDLSLVIGIIYFLTRVIAKVIGAFASTRIFTPIYKVPAKIGLGLISEGGLVIAIVLNFRFFYPSVANSLITIVIVSILASEIISPWLILKQFEKHEVVMKPQS